MPLPLQVDEIGERCRYRVHSEARPQNVYLVDLLAHEGRSECICKDWTCRCWPVIKADPQARPMCKHITAARAHFLNQLLVAMAKTETTAPASTVTHGRR